jgi:hypothetical protein
MGMLGACRLIFISALHFATGPSDQPSARRIELRFASDDFYGYRSLLGNAVSSLRRGKNPREDAASKRPHVGLRKGDQRPKSG